MRVVWLAQARANRADAIVYIAQESPRAALDQLDEIERQTDTLAAYPDSGRPGRAPGTRELVINRTRFVLVYRVRPEAGRVEILRLLHGRQKYP